MAHLFLNTQQDQTKQVDKGRMYNQQNYISRHGNKQQIRIEQPRVNDMNNKFINMNVNAQSERQQQSEPDIDNLYANSNIQNSVGNRNQNQLNVSVPPFGSNQNQMINQQTQFQNPFQSTNININSKYFLENQMKQNLQKEPLPLVSSKLLRQLDKKVAIKSSPQRSCLALLGSIIQSLLQRQRDQILIKEQKQKQEQQQQQLKQQLQQQQQQQGQSGTKIISQQRQSRWQYELNKFSQKQIKGQHEQQLNQVPQKQNNGEIPEVNLSEKNVQKDVSFAQNANQLQNQNQKFKQQYDNSQTQLIPLNLQKEQEQQLPRQQQFIQKSNVNQLQVDQQNIQEKNIQKQHIQPPQQIQQMPWNFNNHLGQQPVIQEQQDQQIQQQFQKQDQQQQIQIIQPQKIIQAGQQNSSVKKQPVISDANKAILQNKLVDSATKLFVLQQVNQQQQALQQEINNDFENGENIDQIQIQQNDQQDDDDKDVQELFDSIGDQQQPNAYQKVEGDQISGIEQLDQNQLQEQKNEPQIDPKVHQPNENEGNDPAKEEINAEIVKLQDQAQKQEIEQNDQIAQSQKEIQPEKEELTLEDAQFIDQNGKPIFKLNIFEQDGPVLYNPNYRTKEQKLQKKREEEESKQKEKDKEKEKEKLIEQQKLEELKSSQIEIQLGNPQPLLRNKWKTQRCHQIENKILDIQEKQQGSKESDSKIISQNEIQTQAQSQAQTQSQIVNQNISINEEEDQVILDRQFKIKQVQKKVEKNIDFPSIDQENVQRQLEILSSKLEELGPSQFMSYVQKKRQDQKSRMQFNREIMESQKQIWALQGFVGHLKPHPELRINQLFEQADENLIDMNDPVGRYGQYIPSIQDQIKYKLLPAPLVSNPVTKEQQQVLNDYLSKTLQQSSEFALFQNDKTEFQAAQQLLREQALLPQYRKNQMNPFSDDVQKQFQPYQSQLSPTQYFYAVNPMYNRYQSYQSLVQQNPQNDFSTIFFQNPNNPFNINKQNHLLKSNQPIFTQGNSNFQDISKDNKINIFGQSNSNSQTNQNNQSIIQQPIPSGVFQNNSQSKNSVGNKPLNIFESNKLFSNNEFNSISNPNYLKPKPAEVPKTFKDSQSPMRNSTSRFIRNQQPIVFKPLESTKPINQYDLSFSKKTYVESPVKLYQQQTRTIYDTVTPKPEKLDISKKLWIKMSQLQFDIEQQLIIFQIQILFGNQKYNSPNPFLCF
ncbi:hypothetical protein pb186bvf_005327 [Paramecium bursaria]